MNVRVYKFLLVINFLAAPICSAAEPAHPLSAAEERALRPKSVFKECDSCPLMTLVPAGRFVMGETKVDLGYDSWDGATPIEVTIARPFAVGTYAVTFEEWDACVAAGGCNLYSPSDGGWGRGTRPVIYVSWHDANSYVEWLSAKTGKPYRLSSESEREYFTRAGTTTPFWWGSSITSDQANYHALNRFAGGPTSRFRGQTVPVATFDANPWGLYNVHGNIWEWVEDCRNASNLGNPGDGRARTITMCQRRLFIETDKSYAFESCERPYEGIGQDARGVIVAGCTRREVRNGAWSSSPRHLRSAHRSSVVPTVRLDVLGFRVVRDVHQ